MDCIIYRELAIAKYYSECLENLKKEGKENTKQAEFCEKTINSAMLIIWKCI